MSTDLKNTKLVTVMTYGSSHVAHTARGLLAQNGIVAEVQGAALADAFSWYGSAVSKIDLVTFEADAERALGIIRQMEQEAVPHQVHGLTVKRFGCVNAKNRTLTASTTAGNVV